MSLKDSNEKIASNEEVINNITKKLESEVTMDCKNEHSSEEIQGNSAEEIAQNDRNCDIPKDFEELDPESSKQDLIDDWIDEEKLKDLEVSLTDDEKEIRYKDSLELKKRGNEQFKMEQYLDSIVSYTEALKLCPLKYESDRSILYANRAASKVKLEKKQCALDDCTKAIELNDKYVKAYLRRAKLFEEMEKLDESLEDYKKILNLDPGNKDALQAQYRLPPLITERNEKLKTEMLGKLKDLGNMILKPFGLSTDNFQLNQDGKSGGYSVNFVQNSGK